MFISITFPVADLRSLHKERAGRLDRPYWGSADPRAEFARGFGSIHTRTKSGIGFVGENYYADCDRFIRYPSQFFVQPLYGNSRSILAYPFYRRFFFDGQFSGRFELGFRLNEASIYDVETTMPSSEYDVVALSSQLLSNEISLHLLDGRDIKCPFYKAMDALRDGYILSSTQNKQLLSYDIDSTGSVYVSVGSPFVVIRSSPRTEIHKVKHKKILIDKDSLFVFLVKSGIHHQHFDTVVIPSHEHLDSETAIERFVRLFYTQVRALSYAHSFYLSQIDAGKIEGPTLLEPAITAMIERLKGLTPVEDDVGDKEICETMRQILDSANVDIMVLSNEIESRLRQKSAWKWVSNVFGYFDKKADIAIEAAASAATKHVLGSGP